MDLFDSVLIEKDFIVFVGLGPPDVLGHGTLVEELHEPFNVLAVLRRL